MLRVLLDTNVLVSALRSTRGASFRLMRLLAEGRYEVVISVALFLEYEEQLQSLVEQRIATQTQVDDVLDFIAKVGVPTAIRFRLRPTLIDPDDEFAVELAFAAGVNYLVTHNRSDFAGASRFGINVTTPGELLRLLERRP